MPVEADDAMAGLEYHVDYSAYVMDPLDRFLLLLPDGHFARISVPGVSVERIGIPSRAIGRVSSVCQVIIAVVYPLCN